MRLLTLLLTMIFVGGCANSLASRLSLPDRNTLVREQLEIHGDFQLSAHHRLFEELLALRADLCRRLLLPGSDEPIHIYLFESEKRFDDFMRLHYPQFPDRRAFFVETDTRLAVYAQWGDRMAEDLRHEVTHGYLHSVAPNIPLWLDEGLAEFYEVPRDREGLNRSHVERLLARMEKERWRPDLHRLEQFPSSHDMAQDDYAEAWAWVHFLLNTEHSQLLQAYVSDLRRGGTAAPLSVRLRGRMERPEEALLEHIRRVGENLPK